MGGRISPECYGGATDSTCLPPLGAGGWARWNHPRAHVCACDASRHEHKYGTLQIRREPSRAQLRTARHEHEHGLRARFARAAHRGTSANMERVNFGAFARTASHAWRNTARPFPKLPSRNRTLIPRYRQHPGRPMPCGRKLISQKLPHYNAAGVVDRPSP